MVFIEGEALAAHCGVLGGLYRLVGCEEVTGSRLARGPMRTKSALNRDNPIALDQFLAVRPRARDGLRFRTE